MPSCLTHIVKTPADLFELFRHNGQHRIEITKNDEMVIKMWIYGQKREYYLPMEKINFYVKEEEDQKNRTNKKRSSSNKKKTNNKK